MYHSDTYSLSGRWDHNWSHPSTEQPEDHLRIRERQGLHKSLELILLPGSLFRSAQRLRHIHLHLDYSSFGSRWKDIFHLETAGRYYRGRWIHRERLEIPSGNLILRIGRFSHSYCLVWHYRAVRVSAGYFQSHTHQAIALEVTSLVNRYCAVLSTHSVPLSVIFHQIRFLRALVSGEAYHIEKPPILTGIGIAWTITICGAQVDG